MAETFNSKKDSINKFSISENNYLNHVDDKYRIFFDNMHDGVAIFEVIGNAEDIIFKDFNRSSGKTDNNNKEALIGSSIFDVCQGVESFSLIDAFKEVWKTGSPKYFPIGLFDDDDKLEGWYENYIYKLSSNKIVAVFNNKTKCKQSEELLRNQAIELRERNKELNCLFKISKIVQNEKLTNDDILHDIVKNIPPSWQYPEFTCARITLKDHVYHTENFTESPWKQSADIIIEKNNTGIIEVYYLKEFPQKDEGPFLKEERCLINTIAEMTAEFCMLSNSSVALQQSEERYRILAEHTAEGVIVIQKNKLVYVNKLFTEMLEYEDMNTVIGKNINDFISKTDKSSFSHIYSEIKIHLLNKRLFHGKLVTKNEREFWVDGHLSFAEWFGKPCIIGTIKDIDQAKVKELSIKNEFAKLKASVKHRYRFGNIIGKSPVMQELYELIVEASNTDAPVTIIGESGTGKEEVARTIHNNSIRKKNGLVAVNCGAIPDSLFESEFFGYKKGAFTGAFMDKHGFFDLANKGTIFLDEVGELTTGLQVKLLRALENGEYTRLGDNTIKKSDVRIISATNANLKEQVNKNIMREDFFYRIHVIPIFIPPLSDRKEDIPLLVEYFFNKYSQQSNKRKLNGKELDLLCDYSWPGNIRELQNVIQRYITSRNFDFFNSYLSERKSFSNVDDNDTQDFRSAIKNHEHKIIINALEKNLWHKKKTAEMLGLSRRTFFRKLQQLGIKMTLTES
ncbi:MAG: PAS domain S-box protein [Desulfobacterales bacterium]|nr:PAS domain S-box protein [Desulfobacterales bacterium]